jgi:two-component system chemotaxis sensor kinase CheA
MPQASSHLAQGATAGTDSAASKPLDGGKRVDAGGESTRVNVRLLDELMNLVGELVLARNQVVQTSAPLGDQNLGGACQHVNLITSELQERAMKTRLQPINMIFGKFPRVVRDLSRTAGKKVRLVLEGKDAEVDRGLIEAIEDPLTHMVRNSVDHGIELPEVRVARGKPEEGMLLLRAAHEGGHVNIDIIDDGGGIDPDKIKAKAISKGLLTHEQAERMSARELTALIFLPGFSTAERVTTISGRGVGMDVVRTNVERVGGVMDVQSVPGRGSTFRLKIPLTLAIIFALVMSSGGELFAIPQMALLELLDVEAVVEMAASTGALVEVHACRTRHRSTARFASVPSSSRWRSSASRKSSGRGR